jgi:hypothetical protein
MMTLNALAPSQRRLALFADRTAQRWVVRDPEGQFWSFPVSGASWNDREPFDLTDDVCLEPVPGHYLVLLGLDAVSLH